MSGSPRVLMVAPQPFFQNRGAPILVYLRCEALARLGCSLELITFPSGENRFPSQTRVRRIPAIPGIQDVPAGPSVRKLFLDFVMFFYLFFFLLGKSREFDWLHCHEESAFFCAPLASLFGIPLVYDHHSRMRDITRSSPYGFGGIPWLLEMVELIGLKGSTGVVCVIPALEEHVRSRTSHDHIFVIPCTAPEELLADDVDPTGLSPDLQSWIRDDKITLGYTGSLAEYQTMKELLEGLALFEERDQVQLLLVGGTEQELAEYHAIIHRLDIEDQVFTTGRVSHDRIPAYLSIVDVLVCPREETKNTPLKIYTYMWSSKPILAADVEGHRVLFDGDEVLWAVPTPEGYREGLRKIMDVELDEMASTVEKKYREQYNFEQFTERHRPLMEIFLQGNRRA